MALLQISEPGMSTAPHEHRLAAGIDLGTTNSLVASVRSGVAEVLPDANGQALLPSVVHYSQQDAPSVGIKAVTKTLSDPLNTIASVKRILGRSSDELRAENDYLPFRLAADSDNVPRIETVHGPRTAVEISADILQSLKLRAEQTLGGSLTGVVITVPAYFDDAQRQATKDAAKLADLNVFRLLNEPTAAAIAYGLDRTEEGLIAVYDLGGGTFDISILRLRKGIFEVLAIGGDSALGGDDFDQAIAQWLLSQVKLQVNNDHQFMRQVFAKARAAKEQLSNNLETSIAVELPDGSKLELSLSRHRFEELIAEHMKKTIFACRRALRDAAIEKEQITEVVMVGGSTRVPLVRQEVKKFFARPLHTDIDPDQVVAIGAAIQADILAGNKSTEELLLLDVTPLSLGIETMGGLVEKIIERNSTIPIARAQEFTTYKDGQTAMRIHVLQGERDLVTDCRSLATFNLTDIPALVAGAAKIRVTFQVDADGLLSVTAQEVNTGVSASIEVKPSYGLSDAEISTMLKDSLDNAKQDMQIRNLREQQVEADRVVEALNAALSKDGERLLGKLELAAITDARDQLIAIRNDTANPDDIHAAIKRLEEVSETYVARRMDNSVRSMMQGHKVEEFHK